MNYLLDTNTISESIKLQPDTAVLQNLKRHQHEIVTGAPVWHELVFGCQRLPPSKKREVIESFLIEVVARNMPILPYDERAAAWHARERVRLGAIGHTPSFVDGQIAAIAKVNGLTLVTRNLVDFEKFADLQLAKWHQSAG